MGSVIYGFCFRAMPYRDAFVMMGSIVIMSSLLTAFIKIPCHAGMFWGEDNHAVIQQRERFRHQQNAELYRRNQTENALETELVMENGANVDLCERDESVEKNVETMIIDFGDFKPRENDEGSNIKESTQDADDDSVRGP